MLGRLGALPSQLLRLSASGSRRLDLGSIAGSEDGPILPSPQVVSLWFPWAWQISQCGGKVNMSDSRVQMSFSLHKADWLPEKVRKKMWEVHKNRISKTGEFSVACQETSSQIDNTKIAIKKIGDLIAQAEREVKNDDWEQNEKLEFKDYVVMKFKREGREKELEKREQALRETKRRMREKTKNKKITMY
ncbi:Peptidyl-tRNA hydrolase ICT1, mitochondrial [Symbiodinium microadriaticum]|uniref:Peptidyl-tRNA hydrolase ICT1, mitochondrial n=1 Tax=Symbiodinium microadriaticum TaxID=2951 RepID=A0A1Q9DV84_SYMMI|nr:Peptidyl-tRNA hydrolase ICT1, mitochondrial [Symbiodinium microadriaticum]